jgi:hypothetical protein
MGWVYFLLLSNTSSCQDWLAEIKESFPWLWVMKELIGERPNLVPVGLGNNESSINFGALDSGQMTKGNTSEDPSNDPLAFDSEDEEPSQESAKRQAGASVAKIEGEDGEEPSQESAAGQKCKGGITTNKTPACPGISAPATATRDSKRQKNIGKKFLDALVAEEATL